MRVAPELPAGVEAGQQAGMGVKGNVRVGVRVKVRVRAGAREGANQKQLEVVLQGGKGAKQETNRLGESRRNHVSQTWCLFPAEMRIRVCVLCVCVFFLCMCMRRYVDVMLIS